MLKQLASIFPKTTNQLPELQINSWLQLQKLKKCLTKLWKQICKYKMHCGNCRRFLLQINVILR